MVNLKTIFKFIFAAGFIGAGVNHFVSQEFYLRMMPPGLPAPLFLVYLSGAFEIVLGTLLLIPKFERFAAWSLIALLVAVFPVNVFMAANARLFPEFSPAALYLRLPLQFVLIFWAYRLTRPQKSKIYGLEK